MLRFIFLLLLFYLFFKLVQRIIFPLFYQNQNNTKKKEGKMTIEYKPKKNKIINKNEGEYVDYKEVK